jgi:hypothetical protein
MTTKVTIMLESPNYQDVMVTVTNTKTGTVDIERIV